MKYYKLMYDFNHDIGTILCEKQEVYGMDQYIAERGVRIDKWNENITFYYAKGRSEDYLDNTFCWPIVSNRIKAIFDKLGVNGIQMLPLRIKQKDGKEKLKNHYLLNILNYIEALDFEKSKYYKTMTEPPRIILLRPIVLKRERIICLDIFRIKEGEEAIYISERVKKEMEKAKITGVDFDEVQVS